MVKQWPEELLNGQFACRGFLEEINTLARPFASKKEINLLIEKWFAWRKTWRCQLCKLAYALMEKKPCQARRKSSRLGE